MTSETNNYSDNFNGMIFPQTPNSLNTTSSSSVNSTTDLSSTSNQYAKNLNFNESPLNTKIQSISQVYGSSPTSSMTSNSYKLSIDEVCNSNYNYEYSNENEWKSSQFYLY